MAIIKIRHFSDNYFEVCSAVSAIISIHNVIHSMNEEIVSDLMKDEIFDDDPEVNASMYLQILSHNKANVTRASSYSYILLACSGIEKALKLLQTDGLASKFKNEGYGDYIKRLNIVPEMIKSVVDSLNDLFTLRHWISHRNGRTELQKLSSNEENVLKRAGKAIFIDDTYIIIEHNYIDSIVKSIDLFIQKVAKAKYE